MKKACIALVLMAAAGCLLLGGADEPDIFANATVSKVAVLSHRAPMQGIHCYTGDDVALPKTVFHAGEKICWWSEGFVVPKGAGIVQETITVAATTPRRTKTFTATFNICNTSDPNTCDDIPDYTMWNLGICAGPLPMFLDKLLKFTGPVPFDSAISGTGWEPYQANLTGNTVAPLP